jgi:N-acylneuraminate cytidylyltransferase
MKTVAFIPIRSGSKGVIDKNIRTLAGKPMVMWCAEAAVNSSHIDEVYIAVDRNDYAGVLYDYTLDPSIKVIHVEYMDDDCMQETPMLEFTNRFEYDIIVLMQATTPAITTMDINGALLKFCINGYDSLITVNSSHDLIWRHVSNGSDCVTPVNFHPRSRKRRQDWDGHLVENGALFITTREAFLTSNCRTSGTTGYFETNPLTAYQIDTEQDFDIMEYLLKKVNQ